MNRKTKRRLIAMVKRQEQIDNLTRKYQVRVVMERLKGIEHNFGPLIGWSYSCRCGQKFSSRSLLNHHIVQQNNLQEFIRENCGDQQFE